MSKESKTKLWKVRKDIPNTHTATQPYSLFGGGKPAKIKEVTGCVRKVWKCKKTEGKLSKTAIIKKNTLL